MHPHVLLDLGEALDRYVTANHPKAPDDRPLQVEDWCARVEPNSRGALGFPLVANGATFEAEIKYLNTRCRYEILCPDLESHYRSRDHREGLVRHLNQLQAFRVLPGTRGYFYTQGQFYHPEAEFGPRYDDEQLGLFKVLHQVAKLASFGSEKGGNDTPFGEASWPEDSLFGLIDRHGLGAPELASVMGKPDLLVCDDMGTEAADFLFADQKGKRAVFIHAKASSSAKRCSASAMTEVCGQATKNTKFLSKFNELDAPPKSPRWHLDGWRSGVNTLPRIRIGTGTGGDLWGQFRALVRDPLSSTEVWIVAGQLLSKGHFRTLLTKKSPDQEAVQLAYLLLSTITSVNAVGAKLRVFCSP